MLGEARDEQPSFGEKHDDKYTDDFGRLCLVYPCRHSHADHLGAGQCRAGRADRNQRKDGRRIGSSNALIDDGGSVRR